MFLSETKKLKKQKYNHCNDIVKENQMKRLNNISFKKNELTLLISSLLLINTSVGAEENA